ncbi:hypothetical protein ACTQ4E_03165 [Lawsonibacter sp. LCP25S3_G6]|uniref:hypothetical protein n=1 Tax=unclassified Lawsonibacter TaxID=2617946 RepID=UPI003F9A4306
MDISKCESCTEDCPQAQGRYEAAIGRMYAMRELAKSAQYWDGLFDESDKPKITPARLRELVEADRDGRCVVRPCKVGDILYEIDETEYGVITCKVLSVNCFNCHALRIPQNPVVDNVVVTIEVIDGHGKGSSYDFAETDFGKTVFLYRETAEAALKGVPLC